MNSTFVQVHASLILLFFFHIYFLLDVYFSAYIFGVIYSTELHIIGWEMTFAERKKTHFLANN